MEPADLEPLVQSEPGPVLSIHCDRDNLAPMAAVQGVTIRLRQSRVEHVEITSDALGTRADHLSWARQPAIAAAAIERWIDALPLGIRSALP
jgi:predicted alpha/beta hydrolase